eukprot:scaffold10633_cov89-Cylindrotheca_fusiformis.AAC.3
MPDEWQELWNRRGREDTTWYRDADTMRKLVSQPEWYKYLLSAGLDHNGWPKESGRTGIEMDSPTPTGGYPDLGVGLAKVVLAKEE